MPLPGPGDAHGQAAGTAARDGAGAMEIEFEMEGGLAHMPGLACPVIIAPDRLPEAEARAIRDQVAAAQFFDRPVQGGAPPGRGADRRSYILTITEGTRRRTLVVAEPIEDETLRCLVRLIEAQARAARRRGAGGQPP